MNLPSLIPHTLPVKKVEANVMGKMCDMDRICRHVNSRYLPRTGPFSGKVFS